MLTLVRVNGTGTENRTFGVLMDNGIPFVVTLERRGYEPDKTPRR